MKDTFRLNLECDNNHRDVIEGTLRAWQQAGIISFSIDESEDDKSSNKINYSTFTPTPHTWYSIFYKSTSGDVCSYYFMGKSFFEPHNDNIIISPSGEIIMGESLESSRVVSIQEDDGHIYAELYEDYPELFLPDVAEIEKQQISVDMFIENDQEFLKSYDVYKKLFWLKKVYNNYTKNSNEKEFCIHKSIIGSECRLDVCPITEYSHHSNLLTFKNKNTAIVFAHRFKDLIKEAYI